MTLSNSVGLMALFLVDLIDLYFLNLLGEQEMAAAVGFSAQILFYVTGISIGLLIAVGIVASTRIGAEDHEGARHLGANALVLANLLILTVTVGLMVWLEPILRGLGAQGRTLELSLIYLNILLPSGFLLVTGMVNSALLRAVGDARRSMYITVFAALVNLVLDPVLIFGFDLGIAGAALSSVLARFTMAGYGAWCVMYIHQMMTLPSLKGVLADIRPLAAIAGPAMLTNLATPIGSTFVMAAIARYGDAAVAAFATIGRIIPVSFSFLFALSGAISPIIGQNFGAKSFGRVRETYRDAIIFAVIVVVLVSSLLFAGQNLLVGMFNFSGDGEELLRLFLSGLTFFFVADGVLFSTNAAFNSLGYPLYSTFFNYAKYFCGVVPAVWFCSWLWGANGVIIGQAVGCLPVTLVAVMVCNRVIARESEGDGPQPKMRGRGFARLPLWPWASAKSQL
jgi:putative MATE family efflux protein